MVCCIPLLSYLTWQPESKLNIKPHYSINETSNSAEAFYQLGRYYQGQQRLEQAATAYRKGSGGRRRLCRNAQWPRRHLAGITLMR